MMKKWMQILILITSISSAGTLLASGGFGEGGEGGGSAMPVVTNAKWKTECGSCHMIYHPGLLPERSWNKVMAGLDKHFGENAGLDASTRNEIAKFLASNSADKQENRRSSRINQSISASAAPMRISETRYFLAKHDELSANTFKRKSIGSPSNCVACHKGAEKGDFSESQIKIPR
jgi:cytochrome c553